ncbi:hypothetical protein [Nocardiopsis lucentensis]|uniref:hypothetical protein n=1 Tax=Nocardiopsis lucentensis TaxID=53441 RepID=UPI000366C4AE|nr:hypothetical protein [Nocardiopsis lucentensis]
MAVQSGRDELGKVWAAMCDQCSAYFLPRLTCRVERDLRLLARRDGWQLPTSAKNRARGKPDLCPTCKNRKEPR